MGIRTQVVTKKGHHQHAAAEIPHQNGKWGLSEGKNQNSRSRGRDIGELRIKGKHLPSPIPDAEEQAARFQDNNDETHDSWHHDGSSCPVDLLFCIHQSESQSVSPLSQES